MSWHSIEMRDSIQVIPSYEHGHVIDLDCWCQPTIEQDDDMNVPLISHRDQLERDGPDDPEPDA